MLVLSRRPGEKIMINDGEIVITVLQPSNHSSLRLGISAHPSVSIDREEIYKKKSGERKRQYKEIAW